MRTHLRRTRVTVGASLLPLLVLVGLAVRHAPRSPILRTVPVGLFPAVAVLSAPPGPLFVANTNESTVSVLDGGSGRLLYSIAVGGGRVGLPRITGMVADAPRGQLVVATDDGYLALVDARRGTVRRYLALPSASAPALDPARARVFAVDQQASLVRMLDARTGRVQQTSAVDGHPAVAVVDGATARVFVTGGQARGGLPQGAGRLSVLSATSGRILRIVAVGRAPCLCLGAPLGHNPVLVSDLSGGQLYVLDPTTARVRRTVKLGMIVYDYAVDPVHGYLVIGGASPSVKGTLMPYAIPGRLVVLDGRTGRVVRRLALATPPTAVAVDAISERVLLGQIGPTNGLGEPQGVGAVTVRDERSLQVERTLPVGFMPWHITVDAATQRAFVLNANIDPSCLGQASYLPLHLAPAEDRWTALARQVTHWLPGLPLSVGAAPVASPNGSVTVVDLTAL